MVKRNKKDLFEGISNSGLEIAVSRNEEAKAYLKGATTVMDEIAELVKSGKFDEREIMQPDIDEDIEATDPEKCKEIIKQIGGK